MSMKITGFDNIEKKINESDVAKELELAMQKTVAFTKEVIVDTIENSGTEKSGKRGRIKTGEMKSSVDTNVDVINDKRVEGTAGWLDGSPEYAKYQELGFNHWISGEFIVGMNSLLEGAAQGTEEAVKLLDDVAKRITK